MTTITCVRCGRTTEALAVSPMDGALGEKIKSQVCPACWKEWVDQQVMVINHYGLQMADPDDRKKLTQAMKEFLGIEPS